MDSPTARRKVQLQQLSKKVIDALAPAEAAFDVFDAKVKGFHVRVYPSGTRVFAVRYRDPSGGKKPKYHRHILGTFGAITAEQARKEAERVRAALQANGNPAREKRERREKATLDDAAESYLSYHDKRVELDENPSERWASEARRVYVHDIKEHLGKRLVEDIGVEDVERLMDRLSDKRATADKARAVLSAILGRAIKTGHRPREVPNPARFVEPHGTTKRDRALQPDEWPRVKQAIAALRSEYAALPEKDTRRHQLEAVLALALTGARMRSITGRSWPDVDTNKRVITVDPPHKGVSMIPLGESAAMHFKALRKARQSLTPFVFPGQARRVGTRTARGDSDDRPLRAAAPISTIRPAFNDLVTRAKLADFTPHDLRRSFASVGAEVGLNDLQIGGLLGHKVPSVTGRYIRPSLDSLLSCADLVSAEVASRLGLIVAPTKAASHGTSSEAGNA